MASVIAAGSRACSPALLCQDAWISYPVLLEAMGRASCTDGPQAPGCFQQAHDADSTFNGGEMRKHQGHTAGSSQ